MSIIFSFPQKTLPLLENQIKESHQKITEELQKYGSDIPEDESGKMFFLIDVSAARGAKVEKHPPLSREGPCALHVSRFIPLRLIQTHAAHLAPQGGRVGGWVDREWGTVPFTPLALHQVRSPEARRQ